MDRTYKVPMRNRVGRSILRVIFRGLFRVLFRIQITGLEHVPKEGAYIISPNHVSLYDPPFVVAFWPVIPEVAGAAEVWERAGQSLLAKMYGGLQIHRGMYDRRVIDNMLRVLRAGRPLLIAPEGGRSHEPGLRQGKPGVAYLLEKSNVPLIPVGVVGTTDDVLSRALRGERPRLEMRVGLPLRVPPLMGRGRDLREARQRNTDLVMSHIAALLPREYRGVYSEYVRDTAKTQE
ncbi:MAG: lysophospholipid acyltransferase family protein [Chloroflexota bacterium]